MWWASSIWEWLLLAGCISSFALATGVVLGKAVGWAHFNTKIPTGHSDNCTCRTCLIERARKWEQRKEHRNKTLTRDREFNYPNALHKLNRPLVSTANLRLADVVVQRLAGRPADKRIIRVYKVINIEREVTEHVIHLLDQVDATHVAVRIPIDQVDQLIWRVRKEDR